MKNFKWLIIGIILISGFLLISQRINHQEEVFCPKNTKECPDGSLVSRIPPQCDFALCPGEKEGIFIVSPKRGERIKSPLQIKGKATGSWFFEGVFSAELYDENNNLLGRAILTALGDWMSKDFVDFEGELNYSKPKALRGLLKFLSANPSGLKETQKVFEVPLIFSDVQIRKVLLYYYNPSLDKDEKGNILCSVKGLVPIEREIPLSSTTIADTLNLLLKGKENLKEVEIKQGITTEFPLEGFSLKEVNLKSDGTLFLKFDDPLNKTNGGACRASILWNQIEKTAKQFKEVKKVEFSPESLFQP